MAKSGAKFTVARGKRDIEAEATEIMAALDQSAESEAMQFAQENALEAAKKLRALYRSRDTPASVARMAAKDLLELAEGKAAPRQQEQQGARYVINIHAPGADVPSILGPVVDAVAVAEGEEE